MSPASLAVQAVQGGVHKGTVRRIKHQALHPFIERAVQQPITRRTDFSHSFIVGRQKTVFVKVRLFVPS